MLCPDGLRVRILIVTQQLIPHVGGLSTHVQDLLVGLSSLGHSVRLVHGGQAAPSVRTRLLHLVVSVGNRDQFAALNLTSTMRNITLLVKRAVREVRPELVHAHDVYASHAVLNALEGSQVPLVQTVHGPALYEAQMGGADRRPRLKTIIQRCERIAFSGVRKFIAVDSGQAHILTNDYGVDSKRVTVIFNAVDVDEIRRLSRRKLTRNLPRQ